MAQEKKNTSSTKQVDIWTMINLNNDILDWGIGKKKGYLCEIRTFEHRWIEKKIHIKLDIRV